MIAVIAIGVVALAVIAFLVLLWAVAWEDGRHDIVPGVTVDRD